VIESPINKMCAPFLRLGIGYEYPDLRGFAETKHPVQSTINIEKINCDFVIKNNCLYS
jgi:hypothetical protein